ARDRTVATNYAQEAMEDIKNMDFDQITPDRPEFKNQPIPGTKFEREVIVFPQGSPNLKEVTTTVSWKDRNGATFVNTSMVIHFIETTAGAATRIILIASPYNVLTENDEGTSDVFENRSIVTAVIKDIKGNTVTTWTGNITFSIDSGSGSFAENSTITSITVPVTTEEKGKASATFYASTEEGTVNITASTIGLTPGSVTIKVTNLDTPVKINLTASSIFIPKSSSTLITAEIVNAGGIIVTDATNVVGFSVSSLGTLSNQTDLTMGVVEITLTSNGTAGTITVTASASGLEPGVINVITGGQISLSALPSPVHNEEKSEITVTTKNVDGVPINYIGTIDLLITPYDDTIGFGNLSPEEFVEFNGDTYLERLTFTASSEGKVKITAIDASGILDQAEIILIINPVLIPHHINVSADPSSIKAGGTAFSTITAWVEADDNTLITSYGIPIIFETDNGTFNNHEGPIESGELYIDENGEVTIKLYSSDTSGTAIITVSSGSLVGVTEVDFYTVPNHINLVAIPQNIQVGNVKFLIEAIMVDENNAQISNYNEGVTFNIISGFPGIIKYQTSNTQSLITTFSGGKAILNMKSVNEAGTATLNADSGIYSGSLNIPVGITLNLVGGTPAYNFTENSVSFNIMIVGAPLSLEEMQISWLPSGLETLSEIVIQSPNTAVPVTIFNNVETLALNGEPINVNDITLLAGISNVKLYFNESINMSEKTLEVIFNPNSGNYPVEFTIPTSTP
ncbi:MAG: hypothetical protein IMZ52_09020, partial [Actinobacteria bacterium]|nr:hypothetical protein [Actinomycetota bacterium]